MEKEEKAEQKRTRRTVRARRSAVGSPLESSLAPPGAKAFASPPADHDLASGSSPHRLRREAASVPTGDAHSRPGCGPAERLGLRPVAGLCPLSQGCVLPRGRAFRSRCPETAAEPQCVCSANICSAEPMWGPGPGARQRPTISAGDQTCTFHGPGRRRLHLETTRARAHRARSARTRRPTVFATARSTHHWPHFQGGRHTHWTPVKYTMHPPIFFFFLPEKGRAKKG